MMEGLLFNGENLGGKKRMNLFFFFFFSCSDFMGALTMVAGPGMGGPDQSYGCVGGLALYGGSGGGGAARSISK